MTNLKTTRLMHTSLKSTGVGNKGNEVKEMTLQTIAYSCLFGAIAALAVATIEMIRGNDYSSTIYGMIASWMLVIAVLIM